MTTKRFMTTLLAATLVVATLAAPAAAQVPDGDVSVTKTVDNAAPSEGGTVVYTIVATNNGSVDATAVAVTDALPAGVVYSSDDGAGAYAAGVWTVGTLAGGASATLNIAATVNAASGDTVTNTATVSAAEADPNIGNNVSAADFTVTNPDLALTKTVDVTRPTDGSNVVYTVIATNNGPNDATGVEVADALPSGVTYVSDDSGGTYAGGIWTIGTLAAGASATLNITAMVDANSDGATVVNTATISGSLTDPVSANDEASATIEVRIDDLCATTGSMALPGGGTAPVRGYTIGDCSASPTVTAPGGPVVTADEGDTVSITLHNGLAETTSLWFPQSAVAPDLTGVAPGGSATYSFVAGSPGTFLYEAGGATGPHQVATGMSGALVVYPAGGIAEGGEHFVVVSEIDLALLNNPAGFDLRDYAPDYQIVNGAVAPAGLPVAPGETVRLRYLNVGLEHHSIGLLGLHQHMQWMDGYPLPAGGYSVVSESFAPGQTAEALVSIPATASDGTKYALYEGTFLGGTGAYGGMLTYLEVGGTPPPPAGTPPVTTGVVVTPTVSTDGNVVVTATITDPDLIGVTAAELFLDASGAGGTGIAPDTPGIHTWSVSGLTSGIHNAYVHGEDGDGWGNFAVASFRVDVDGPVVGGLNATPNPTSGQVNVNISATANDSTTGWSNIAGAEYRIDGGAASPMTVSPPNALIASLDAVIPAATMQTLADGPHTVDMRAQDAAGNWSGWTVAALTINVDAGGGPATSNVMVRPGVTNGFQGYTPTIPSIRVDATFTDATSNIAAGEGFIDTVGADGTGFPMTPADGLYNELVEIGYVYIPLTTIRLLPAGTHDIWVHGKDVSGNWGTAVSGQLLIESDLPTVATVTLAPTTTDTTVPVAVEATATDATTDIVWAEWFTGADPGAGNGTDMTVAPNGAAWDLAGTIVTTGWAPGNYVIEVRARDAAGNWSATASATLTVTPAPPTTAEFLDFSTVGNSAVPGVAGPDDADVYSWDATIFSRLLDGSAVGLPGNADIDGLSIDITGGEGAEVFYVSFNANGGTNVPSPGGGSFLAEDEDVVLYDAENGEWQPFFDGAECGLDASNGRDVDAIHVAGGNLYFSTVGNQSVDGVAGPYDNADVYLWDGAGCSRLFDATVAGVAAAANVDGVTVFDSDTIYMSFAADAVLPDVGAAQDEDVVLYDAGIWSLYFDGTGQGLTAGGHDLDAINVR